MFDTSEMLAKLFSPAAGSAEPATTEPVATASVEADTIAASDRRDALLAMFVSGQLEHEDLGTEEPLPNPCPRCRSLDVWWDALGGTHCQQCGPPEASRRLRRHAIRIRANRQRRVLAMYRDGHSVAGIADVIGEGEQVVSDIIDA